MGPEILYPACQDVTGKCNSTETAAIRFLRKDLIVRNIPGSSLIQVTFTHRDPVMAAKVVNTACRCFSRKNILKFLAVMVRHFLEGQLKIFQEKLRESEGNLANFKQKNRVFSFEEQKTSLDHTRSALDTSLKAAQSSD